MMTMMISTKHIRIVTALAILLSIALHTPALGSGEQDRLADGFQDPPAAARPDAFWPWLNGHVDRARITEEMEQFKAAGFSRLQVWDVLALQDSEKIVPPGPTFLSDAWLENFAHANREALRLGLELGLVGASGWNAGGPWVKPEQAGVGLYHSSRTLEGPFNGPVELVFPEVPGHAPRDEEGRPSYWRTVSVQAIPAAFASSIDPERIIDLTDQLDADGRLNWQAPAGAWTINWFIFANTGQQLIVPSPNSNGLQIDFFDADDSREYFNHVLDRLESALGPLEDSALRYIEVDSLELEGNRLNAWTEDILDDFRARYGYDATPYLLLLKGASTSDDSGERFLHDWTRLVSDLMIENHYRLGNEILQERGLFLSAEAGGPGPPIWRSCPVDAMGALGAVGLMRGEFWAKQRSMYNVKQIACAAHSYGHTIVDAESFTCWRHWRDGPYYLKLLADQAFIDGLNHITFHTSPHSPADAGLPGFAYHAGTHMSPNLIWWPMAKSFIDYLSRCSFMLQQGQPVADVCFYQGDGAPNFHPLAVDYEPNVRPAGYDYDIVDIRVLLDSMAVRDGRLVLPHGVSYALLALPESESIDVAALRKIRELVLQGATVVGPKPSRSNSLANDAASDDEVRTIANELWGAANANGQVDHQFGRGRVISGRSVVEVLEELSLPPDFAWDGGDARTSLSFVHRSMDDQDIYFIVNNNERWEHVEGVFRVQGKAPEIWDPSEGTRRPERRFALEDGRTRVNLRLPPGGSTFVVFREGPVGIDPITHPFEIPSASVPPAPDVAHCDTPNGPMWLSDGTKTASGEFIIFDLGALRDIGSVDVWNFHNQTRGLLNRGVNEMNISVSADDSAYKAVRRIELHRAPDIGERDYQQRVPIESDRVRFVRFDIASNHGNDWLGLTNYVGLSRVVFYDATESPIDGVRIHAVSSGVAHHPTTDDHSPPAFPAVEFITDHESGTVVRVWGRLSDAEFGAGLWPQVFQRAEHIPQVTEIPGPWRVRFQAERGAPEEAIFPALISWPAHEHDGIRHFSGIAEYTRTFTPPAALLANHAAVMLDLGRVAGVARVTLNGEDLGTLWKPPYAIDVTRRLRSGENELKIELANTWHNRLVGDAHLEPDQRFTRTNVRRPFTPETPLIESGLLGPVRLHAALVVPLNEAAPIE